MTTLNVTHTFTNGTTADATQVNTNFNDVETFVNTNVVHADGTVKAGVNALDFALTGVIAPYIGSTAPTGWLFCRGQAVSKTTYAALYAVVGPNAFGSDTATDFYLPNLMGRVPVGVSTSDGDFDRADTGGVKDVTLTAAQSGLVGHNHTQNPHNHDQVAHNHGLNATFTVSASNAIHNNANDYASTGLNGGTTTTQTNSITSTTATNVATTATNNAVADANASQAHTNLQPYIALNYIVKV